MEDIEFDSSCKILLNWPFFLASSWSCILKLYSKTSCMSENTCLLIQINFLFSRWLDSFRSKFGMLPALIFMLLGLLKFHGCQAWHVLDETCQASKAASVEEGIRRQASIAWPCPNPKLKVVVLPQSCHQIAGQRILQPMHAFIPSHQSPCMALFPSHPLIGEFLDYLKKRCTAIGMIWPWWQSTQRSSLSLSSCVLWSSREIPLTLLAPILLEKGTPWTMSHMPMRWWAEGWQRKIRVCACGVEWVREYTPRILDTDLSFALFSNRKLHLGNLDKLIPIGPCPAVHFSHVSFPFCSPPTEFSQSSAGN